MFFPVPFYRSPIVRSKELVQSLMLSKSESSEDLTHLEVDQHIDSWLLGQFEYKGTMKDGGQPC